MNEKKYSCALPCDCQLPKSPMSFVVLTGGPGAGKTAVLEFVRKILCEHIAILPEAASILFGGGFWRLDSKFALRSAQRTIFHIQSEMELVAAHEKNWHVALCDRGTLDGLAYWPGNPEDFFNELDTSLEQEYERYTGVIHLSTPPLSRGYNHDNPIRIETAEEAAEIDHKIHQIWKDHPGYARIGHAVNFTEKIQEATRLILNHLPTCCREKLKLSELG